MKRKFSIFWFGLLALLLGYGSLSETERLTPPWEGQRLQESLYFSTYFERGFPLHGIEYDRAQKSLGQFILLQDFLKTGNTESISKNFPISTQRVRPFHSSFFKAIDQRKMIFRYLFPFLFFP